MSIYTKPLKQNIIYWPKVGNNTYGKPAYGPPQPLRGRWDVMDQNIITADGRTVVSKAQLMLSADVLPESILFLVDLDPFPDPLPPTPPTQIDGGQEVLSFQKLRNIKQNPRKTLRIAYV